MILSRQFSYEFAIVAILSIIIIFFFPAVFGSYSAVHGPVTALRSARAKLQMLLLLAGDSLQVCGYSLLSFCRSLLVHGREVLLARLLSFEGMPILRC